MESAELPPHPYPTPYAEIVRQCDMILHYPCQAARTLAIQRAVKSVRAKERAQVRQWIEHGTFHRLDTEPDELNVEVIE